MINAGKKISFYSGILFCFLASVVISVVALNIGLITEPGKILPTGISMRSGEMSRNIIRGIDLAIEDLNQIRSARIDSNTWRLLTFIHSDFFFYLALLMPAAASKTVLLIGYYIRFGVCCSAMYYFMMKHIKLSRLFSALLAVMYTFSSQIIFTAQFSSIMNMAIMLPVLMSVFDSYLRNKTWTTFCLVGIASFGLCASGGFGTVTGIPAVIIIGLLMSISLYSSFKTAFFSWIKLLGGIALGLDLSLAFVLPGLAAMNLHVDYLESFKNARVTYTVFELIRGTFLLRSGSLYQNTAPLFYIGILTIIAVLAFALNEQIPIRLKVVSAIIVSVFHIACCSSFVNEIISIFGTAPALNSSRLICLEIILIFLAGIGLKNASTLKRGDLIAICFIPLFFLIISGNSTSGTSFASPIVVSTFLGILGESVLVYALSRNKLSKKAKYVSLFAVFFLVGVNTSFVMFNNTIQKKTTDEYFKINYGSKSVETLISDIETDLPLIKNKNKYLIIPADMSSYESGNSVIDDLNYFSVNTSGSNLFEEIFLNPSDKREYHQEGPDTIFLNMGYNNLSYCPFAVTGDERIFIYCNAANGATIGFNTEAGDNKKVFTGPFITEIDIDEGEVSIDFEIESDGDDLCRIQFLKLNESAFKEMQLLSGNVSGSVFTLDTKGLNGICTLMLPYSYDYTDIYIDGSSCDTFNLSGNLATKFSCNNNDDIEVSIEKDDLGIGSGVLFSSVALVCFIAIPILQRYNKLKKVTGEGNMKNA